MDAQRKRFVAALVVFLLWIGLLSVLAVRSAKPPAARAAVTAPR
jgi:hypothetical protein